MDFVSGLLRVIAVGQTQERGDASLDLLSLELHEDGFAATFRKRWLADSPSGVYFQASGRDDKGNVYAAKFGGSPGGSQGPYGEERVHVYFARPLILFTPSLDPAAGELRIEVMELGKVDGGSRMEPILPPWVFTVPVPPIRSDA